MDRKGSAVWSGGFKDGKGMLSTESGVLKDTPYSLKTRIGGGGTNPEEILAAAHAGCFTMAVAGELEKLGMKAEKIETTATVTLEQVAGGSEITKSYLNLVATIPGADKGKFDQAMKEAERLCPVSKLFKAEIKVTSKLNS